jgi:uncharacterized membrane protein
MAREQQQSSRASQPDRSLDGRGLERDVLNLARILSVTAGGALAIYGLARRSKTGAAMAAAGGYLLYTGISGNDPLFAAASGPVEVMHAVTIARPVEEVFAFWRELENLPRFLRHLESVEQRGERRSHWVARGPAGTRFEWDAEIVFEDANSHLAWQSIAGSEIDNAGTVLFAPAPGERGTELIVTMQYDAPAGRLGTLVARLFGENPQDTIREDLRRMKALLETGEIPTVAGQSHGPRSLKGRANSRMWGETEPEATQRVARRAS